MGCVSGRERGKKGLVVEAPVSKAGTGSKEEKWAVDGKHGA